MHGDIYDANLTSQTVHCAAALNSTSKRVGVNFKNAELSHSQFVIVMHRAVQNIDSPPKDTQTGTFDLWSVIDSVCSGSEKCQSRVTGTLGTKSTTRVM